MTYEELLMEADSSGITVKELPLQSGDGRCMGCRIAIREDISTFTKKAGVLAEELGHCYTTVGNILDQNCVNNYKQELRARLWAYNKQIGLSGLIKGYQNHCQNLHELAECLDVTEEFLVDALDCYKEKYGTSVKYKGHTIIFEPTLTVIESFMD